MSERVVTTTGVGRSEARPELAEIELEAAGEGASPAVARRAMADSAATVRTALEDEIEADPTVRAPSVRIEETTEFDESDAAFRAVEQLALTCSPDEVSEIVVAVTDEGARVRDVTFGLRAATRAEVKQEALREAVRAARRDAETIAHAENQTVGDVLRVEPREPEGMQSLVEQAIDASGDLELATGPIEVAREVEVDYRLTE